MQRMRILVANMHTCKTSMYACEVHDVRIKVFEVALVCHYIIYVHVGKSV